MKAEYKCPVCGDNELDQSCMEGYTGMCDGCASEQFNKDLEKKWDKELAKYNSRTGYRLSFNEFCIHAADGQPRPHDLRGLTELKAICKRELENIAQRLYEDSLPPELNFNGNDLPF